MTSFKALRERLNGPLAGESCRESFKLMLEVMSSKHATPELVRDAVQRHSRVIGLHEHREKEAA